MNNTNTWINRICCIFLFIFCEIANHFVAVRKIWVIKGIVLVVKGLNIINLYAIYDQVTGPEQPIYVVLCVQYESKKGGKDQESIQSSTTPDPGYLMGKEQPHNLTPQMIAKRSGLSQQVTTRQHWADAKAWQTQYRNNTNDPPKKYRLGTVN